MEVIFSIEGRRMNILNNDKISFSNVFSNITLQNDIEEYRMKLDLDTLVITGEDAQFLFELVGQIGTSKYIEMTVAQPMTGINLFYYIDLDAGHLISRIAGKVQKFEFKVISQFDFRLFYDRARSTSWAEIFNKKPELYANAFQVVKTKVVELDLFMKETLAAMQTAGAARALLSQTNTLSKDAAQIIAAATPAVGLGAVVTVGQIIFAAIQLALDLAVWFLIIYEFKTDIQNLKELVIPKTRDFKGIKLYEAIELACKHMGFEFQSNYIKQNFANVVILPTPMRRSKYKFADGVLKWLGDQVHSEYDLYFTNGYPDYQDGEISQVWPVINYVCERRMLKAVNTGTKIIIEPEDYFISISNVSFPEIPKDQDNQLEEFSYNTGDKWKRTYIGYQTDPKDLYTMDNTDYLHAEYSMEATANDGRIQNLTNLQDRRFPFALGKPNEKINIALKALKKAAAKIDEICGTSFASAIPEPLRELIISDHYFNVPKILTVNSDGYITEDYYSQIDPHKDWDLAINKSSILKNGGEIFADIPFNVTTDQVRNLHKNQFVKIGDKTVKLYKFNYYPKQGKVLLTYKKPFNYEQGKLKELKIN